MASLRAVFLSLFAAVIANHVSSAPSAQTQISAVEVDVYYEALCPDSRRFFLKQLWPTYKKIGNSIILKFIPYGNAEVSGSPDKWTFTCQHGPEECRGNMIQTCATEVLNNTMDSLKFVVCAFNTVRQEKIITECIRDKELQVKIRTCADGSMGKNLEREMALLTDALDPPQDFIPWITINKKGSSEINNKANNALLDLICSSYEGEKPSSCPKSMKKKFVDYYERGAYL